MSRSGTTLLRLMLDAHPQLAVPPETHFLPAVIRAVREGADREQALAVMTGHRRWPDFRLDERELAARWAGIERFEAGEALRAFYRLYAEQQGKLRWGDKTPHYTRKMPVIERALPEARFIHLIRDGRDVALSLMAVHFGPDDVRGAADRWRRWIVKARGHGERVRHYREWRYEDLVMDTESTLRAICEYVELEWDPVMLDYHEGASRRLEEITRDFHRDSGAPPVPAQLRAHQHRHASEPPRQDRSERWRREMSPADQQVFEEVAGELLEALGYPGGAVRPPV